MKRILTAIVLTVALLLAPVVGLAQTTVSVNINTASFYWNWTQGTGGAAAEFLVKCGASTGQYTKITSVIPTARSLPVKDGITGPGEWYCAVTAANEFGESGPSNEVHFRAGTGPVGPTDLRIQSQ